MEKSLDESLRNLYTTSLEMALAQAEKATGEHREHWQRVAQEMEKKLEVMRGHS